MSYRELFEGIETPVKRQDGKDILPILFDNAATTPPFKKITQNMSEDIKMYSSIGRGTGQKGEWCSEKFEKIREQILNFFGVTSQMGYSVIYVKNTTEGLNLLAHGLVQSKRERVLLTRMEHHANDLPWRDYATVDYAEVDQLGRINLEHLEQKLRRYQGTIRYVSVTAASNVTGYITPIHEVAKLVHRYGAQIIVDGAQIVAHQKIDLKGSKREEAIDFFVFSAHKMYAPYGAGAIIGKTSELRKGKPLLTGGGIVDSVMDNQVNWLEAPALYEAGTQNFLGVSAMARAMASLNEIGFSAVIEHEQTIKNYLYQELNKMPQIRIYGDTHYTADRLGVIPLNLQGVDHTVLANSLANEFGIATRCGKFCAHPYVNRLIDLQHNHMNNRSTREEVKGMVRISLGLYNTLEEAKYFVEVMAYLVKYFAKKNV